MTKLLNYLLLALKFILLLISFVITFFIMISMYNRLYKNVLDCIPTMLPFILLLFLFTINIILKQKETMNNIFFNLTCCLVFMVILVSAYRSFFDQNMVMITKLGYNINFNYFADVIAPMRAMLYLLVLADIILMIVSKMDQLKVKNEHTNKTKVLEEAK